MRVIVTGATGFIGSHLVAALRARGDAVTSISHLMSESHIRSLFERVRPDVLFHLAALYKNEASARAEIFDANVRFGMLIANAAAESGVGRFVWTGSALQNLASDVGVYVASKTEFEKQLAELTELPSVSVRLHETFGRDDQRPKLVPRLLECARSGEVCKLASKSNELDFVYIEDVVSGLLKAAKLPGGTGAIFEIASRKPLMLDDVVKTVERVWACSIRTEWGAYQDSMIRIEQVRYSYPLIPGWSATTSLDEGLRRMKHD